MGNYAPVLDEITETSIQVTGSIPTDLNGLFLRNGPNPVDWVNPKKHHWFLGDGMLHGVRLDNGNALWYKNRRVLGNDSTANTSVISHAGHTYAIVEAGGYPVEIDGELNSLDTKPFLAIEPKGSRRTRNSMRTLASCMRFAMTTAATQITYGTW